MKEIKDKYLTKTEFEKYIAEHHCVRIDLSYFDKTANIFYACDNDILLSHSVVFKTYLLKVNREAVLHDWELVEKRKTYYPLTRFNDFLENFSDSIRQTLLNELWTILQIPSPDLQKMQDEDLKNIDTKLNILDKEYIYDDLPLHLAIFCGERMKAKLGGGTWEIRENTVYGTKKHTFKGKDGKDFEMDVVDKTNVLRIDKTPLFVTPIDKIKVDFVHKILKNLSEYNRVRLHLFVEL